MAVQIIIGDALEQLGLLPSNSVHCCISSPPYYGLRDYGVAGQIGLEETPQAYIAALVVVFREVRRILRPDAVIFLNLGDSYHGKQLMMMPARVALALQADGWWLRSEIVWHKPNPMPESCTDRPTSAHEKIFLLAKSERYFYDAEAIAEPATNNGVRVQKDRYLVKIKSRDAAANLRSRVDKRNKRNVWTVPSQSFSDAHFATFPPGLIEPCILAGTSAKGVCTVCGAPWVREVEVTGEWRVPHNPDAKHNGEYYRTSPSGGLTGVNVHRAKLDKGFRQSCNCDAAVIPATVLDPFAGAGTTGLVADRLGRDAVMIELNPAYSALARARIESDAGLFAEVPEPVRPTRVHAVQEMLL